MGVNNETYTNLSYCTQRHYNAGAALDFGVNLSNTTGLNGTNKIFNISQADSAEAFIEFPIGDFSSIYISGEARFSASFLLNRRGRYSYSRSLKILE